MRLSIYRGFHDEEGLGLGLPRDVTHVIVDDTVSVIKEGAFFDFNHLVSVIMGDSVKRIERYAFNRCYALRFLRLSRTLEYIADGAFQFCHSLEALFLPSTVNSIEMYAFDDCRSLRLLVLPHDIDLNNVDGEIINDTGILQIAENVGVAYERNADAAGVAYESDDDDESDDESDDEYGATAESIDRVNEWLIHHMDATPFHKLCYNSSISTKQISDYLHENGNDLALEIDPHHGMTPLHMLSMNPHAPADTILTLLKANTNAVNVEDNRGKTPLYYALHYNPCAFVRMYSFLREHTIEIDIQSWEVDPPVEYDDTDDDTDGDDDTDDDMNDPGCTPLHVLARNPFVPANVIAALLELKMEDAFCLDIKGLSPLDCARESNVDGLVKMIAVLCNHRNSTSSFEGGGGGGGAY